MGFSPHTRIQLTPVLVYAPKKAEEQVVRIASGEKAGKGALITSGCKAGRGCLHFLM